MATTIYYFTGRAFWAKVYEHNLDDYGGVKSSQIELELNKEQRDLLKASGSRCKPKLMDDGTVRVKFKRKFVNEYKPEFGGLPQLLNAEGEPTTDIIGNGSEVTVKVVVYDTQMGKGTRLESIRVDTLVPYVKAESESSSVPSNSSFLVGTPF